MSRQPAIIKQQLTPDRLVSRVPHQIEMESVRSSIRVKATCCSLSCACRREDCGSLNTIDLLKLFLFGERRLGARVPDNRRPDDIRHRGCFDQQAGDAAVAGHEWQSNRVRGCDCGARDLKD